MKVNCAKPVKLTNLNGSKLSILCYFVKELKMCDIILKIKFYVVPNDTMNFDCILGQDFYISSRDTCKPGPKYQNW